MGNCPEIFVLIDPRRPTGLGESISGEKAFFVNVLQDEYLPHVESEPAFKQLTAEEKEIVRKIFPDVLERFRIITSKPEGKCRAKQLTRA